MDLINAAIGRWTVVAGPDDKDPRHFKWMCRCSCGTIKWVREDVLRKGKSSSCGCLQREKATTHGQSKTKLYRVWDSMWQRCDNPKNERYAQYGGQGIVVCQEWETFEGFYEWAQSSGYKDGLTIERINNNEDYTPANCTWVPMRRQQRNTQKTLWITAWGETKALPDWIEDPRCKAKYHTVYARLQKGWDPEDALSK